jgi:outer membrane protein assembly factor BamB
VTAVNLRSRTHAWSRAKPHTAAEATMSSPGGPLVAGGGRVFQLGGKEAVVTYRLSDGAVLWTAPRGLNSQNRPNAVSAIAAANNVVYTGGDEGIVAYDAPSGRRLWTTPTYSGTSLVVAGGRVFSSTSVGLAAVNAAGCGRSTCPVLWSRQYWGEPGYPVQIGGVDGSTLFITYSSGTRSFLERLSAATGAQQWSVPLADKSLQPPVRAGSTVWLRKGCVSGGVTTICLMAFPATGTSTRPLLTVALPQSRHSAVGGLAVSGGTVIDLDWPRYITGYRVPGT